MQGQRLVTFQYWPQVIALLIICASFLGYVYFAYFDTRSNDAYVSADIINISPLVAGPISKLYISENQFVKKGDKLIQIDSRPYDYALQKAEAKLNLAKINYENDKLAIIIAQEKLEQTQSLLALSNDHFIRYQSLTKQGDLAKITLIDIESKIKEQEAQVIAAAQQLKLTQQNFDNNKVLAAEAAKHIAQYLYNHTLITAPTDGYITNFNLRVGQYIKVGEGLFALVDTSQWWVVTRYRETAIRLIKPGDKAIIKLDMYPGKTFHGHVKSIGWGINRVQSGNVAPSTLAYLEPTEDWIKIAQRFPVRIYFDEIDPAFPLRIGASATTITYR